ncbi:hypothetical protein CDAR_182031 [Caerostris darwini]|uniref:Transmembrane protein n=1 Tax=Caerostris darwini TaxID=1538125 RepID=A0AAV4MVR9_9ARAC|nr:hypothetical protein CDAR_182031 [Caerostris darwini]
MNIFTFNNRAYWKQNTNISLKNASFCSFRRRLYPFHRFIYLVFCALAPLLLSPPFCRLSSIARKKRDHCSEGNCTEDVGGWGREIPERFRNAFCLMKCIV